MPRFLAPFARSMTALALASLAIVVPASGQRPTRPPAARAAAAVDPLQHLHRGATAFARIDLARLRSFRHFRSLVRHGARELDASTRAASRLRALLEHTDTLYVSLVRGPGRTADIGGVLLHGNYAPNEVPSAIEGLLPGSLGGLWAETTIGGKRAYDAGVGALVQLSDHDWLLARRIGSDLPVAPRQPPPALASAEYQRLSGLAGFGRGAAEGLLVGATDVESAQPAPDGPGFLYHRTRAAYGHLSLAEGAEARFAFEMLSDAGAVWRADDLRELLARIQQNLLEEQGTGGTPMRFAVEQRGSTVECSVTLDPRQVDAYVARFLAGRLLSAPRTSESAPVTATAAASGAPTRP